MGILFGDEKYFSLVVQRRRREEGKKGLEENEAYGMMHLNLDIGTFARVRVSFIQGLFCCAKMCQSQDHVYEPPRHMLRLHSF